MNTNTICVGRDNELERYGDYIRNYDPESSYIFNLHGAGGIGKTILTQQLHEDYRTYLNEKCSNARAVYINASGCFSISSILFKLRMELDDIKDAFEKFDTMYELFYDATGYAKAKEMRELMSEREKGNGTHVEYRLTEEIAEEQKNLAKLILRPVLYAVMKAGISQMMPLIGLVSPFELIEQIKSVMIDKERKEKYIEILEEIRENQSITEKDSLLMKYFREGITGTNIKFFFIDNFQNPEDKQYGEFRFNNIAAMLQFCRDVNAFWFISSRNPLADDYIKNKEELKGLSKASSERMIESAVDRGKVKDLDIIKENILQASSDGSDSDGTPLYSPIVIRILCFVLEKEVERVAAENPGANNYTISATRFKTIPEDLDLAYYFEMGRAIMDLDCFHILSCLDIWDNYSLSVLKEKIQLYILNTKYLLARDSMTELVGENTIKLHERISQALRESPSNRIRYDVYAIMYDTFIEIQKREPISNVEALRNFFELAKAFCNCVKDTDVYEDRKQTAFEAYTEFYLAFLKTVNNIEYPNMTEELLDVYYMVVKAYETFLENADEDDFELIYEAYFELGLLLYDLGKSQAAAEVDKEYLDFARESGGVYGLAGAQNAFAYDLSGRHKYDEAYKYGRESLETALKGIETIGIDEGNTIAAELVNFYRYNFIEPRREFDISKIEELMVQRRSIIEQHRDIFSRLKEMSENDAHKNSRLIQLWELILRARGNFPWYLLQSSELRQEWAKYAISYGIDTYLLRCEYFGKTNRVSFISYHNIGVYLLKYMEYCFEGELNDSEVNFVVGYYEIKEVFEKAFRLRVDYLRKRIEDENELQEQLESYYQRLDEEKILKGVPTFLEIYSREYIENIPRELMLCNMEALESIQYKANACYWIYQVSDNEEERRRELEEAIACVEQVAIVRSIVLGIYHRKTLESMRYAAEFYWKQGQQEEAAKRIKYAFSHLDKEETSDDLYDEYKVLYEKIVSSASNN